MPHKDPKRRREYMREYSREYYRKVRSKNPELLRESSRKWRAANRELASLSSRRWNARNKGRKLELSWLKKGINVDEAKQAKLEHDGHCACCDTFTPGNNGWVVDHDHHTGRIRGILCTLCNTGIGHLGDTLAGVEKAAAYLRRK